MSPRVTSMRKSSDTCVAKRRTLASTLPFFTISLVSSRVTGGRFARLATLRGSSTSWKAPTSMLGITQSLRSAGYGLGASAAAAAAADDADADAEDVGDADDAEEGDDG